MELHEVKTGKNKFRNQLKTTRDNPSNSFRNSSDRGSKYSRDNKREESTTVTCSDCGTECQVPFVPRTGRPVYCSDCFRQNKPQDSGNDRYSSDRGSRNSSDRGSRNPSDRGSRNPSDRGSRYSNNQDSRSNRDDNKSKRSNTSKFLKKQESFYSGGSEKFYNTLKEKLFEILGGKVCTSCGFKDERALGFGHIHDEDAFDDVRRGGSASSWGKYISDPQLAKNELKILCLNCNELKKPTSPPEKQTRDFQKKRNRFPR